MSQIQSAKGIARNQSTKTSLVKDRFHRCRSYPDLGMVDRILDLGYRTRSGNRSSMVTRMSQLTMCLVWSIPHRALIRNVIDDLATDCVRYPRSKIRSTIPRSGYDRSPQMHTIPKSPSARQRLLKSHIALKSPETPYLMSCSIKARITRAAQPESSAPIESTELIENHLSPNEQNRSPSNKTDMRSSRKSEMIAT